jgi:hypothetical protein
MFHHLAARPSFVRFVGCAALFLTTIPLFFEIYRTAAFNTVSRDDYAPYLLGLVGDPHGKFPGSPAGYRLFSVAPAILFYHLLPLYTFKTLDVVDIPYLRATQALAMFSYLAIVLTAVVMGRIARRRYGASLLSSLAVALLSVLLTDLVGRPGVDVIAVFMISLVLLCQDQPLLFTILLLLSAGVNEKIPLLFTAVMGARLAVSTWRPGWAGDRRPAYWQWLAPLLALGMYAIARAYVRLPGHEEQTSVQAFLPSVVAFVFYTLSPKGLVLNLLPIVVLLLIMWVAYQGNAGHGGRLLPLSDISGFLVLSMLASVASLGYTVGRLVMYAFPLYLPATAPVLDAEFGRRAEEVPGGGGTAPPAARR